MPPLIPRGIRNHNPGNIKISPAPWLGKTSPNTDGTFEQFDTAEHGLRALCLILRNYHRLYGLQTLRQYIERWAPNDENNTAAYLGAVCGLLNTDPDQSYDVGSAGNLSALAAAIIHEECGEQPYNVAALNAGATMALT